MQEKAPERAVVDVVLPVYNEEQDIPRSVETLRPFLAERLPWPWRIVIADNGSTDSTLAVAQGLAQAHPEVRVIAMPEKGRGRALRRAWLESDAQVLTYMDVDLSTDLNCFPPLVSAIIEEGYDVAIGSRLARGARVYRRTLKREVLSRGYITLIKALFWTRFSDAQCGFKAVSRAAARRLLPHVRDDFFFFDTELLIIAEKRGLRVKEVPVVWVDDPDSRVNIARTVGQDLRGLMRLRLGGIPRLDAPEVG
jgi:glycosyltransferase involved in cell wall biosynthesis